MYRGIILSGLLHVVILLFAVVGLPEMWRAPPVASRPIPVELIDISELTNIPRAEAQQDVQPDEAKRDDPDPDAEKSPPPEEPTESQVAALATAPRVQRDAKLRPQPEADPDPDALVKPTLAAPDVVPSDARRDVSESRREIRPSTVEAREARVDTPAARSRPRERNPADRTRETDPLVAPVAKPSLAVRDDAPKGTLRDADDPRRAPVPPSVETETPAVAVTKPDDSPESASNAKPESRPGFDLEPLAKPRLATSDEELEDSEADEPKEPTASAAASARVRPPEPDAVDATRASSEIEIDIVPDAEVAAVQRPAERAQASGRPKPKPKPPPEEFTSVLRTVEDIRRARRSPNPADTERQIASVRSTDDPAGERLTVSEIDAIRQQFSSCWNIDPGMRNLGRMVVTIRVSLNIDRTVRTAQVISPPRPDDEVYRAFADSARRAVLNPRCSPVRVPPNKLHRMRAFTLHFNAKDMVRF